MDIDFTFGLGLEVEDLPPNPEKDVDNYTRDPISKVVAIQYTEQQMEDTPTMITHAKQKKPSKLAEITINLTLQMDEFRVHNQQEEFR